ncbi:MAG TPA: right-handed parallel beta-helix repeat-containing protein [Verrucomicrobiae bacterium]|nr:right-handed parallel beta-helix repeat-containing protein [Verrucomicrobiae bacterium]
MKSKIAIITLLALLIVSAATSARAQGALAPSGAPAPMMKTLEQIEPRTPISSLPFTISSSGSYYLTSPLHSTNSGITVSADDVTIDLMGFTISGTQDTNHSGIFIAGGDDVMRRNVVVRNGGITRFGIGIHVKNTQSAQISHLIVYQNAAEGIKLISVDPGVCTDVTVEQCTITDNSSYGIYGYTKNDSQNNRDHTIRNNRISGNYTAGVRLFRTRGCVVEGNAFGKQVPGELGAFAVYNTQGYNFTVRNFERGNTNGIGAAYWGFQGSETFGPLVDVTGYLTVTNNTGSPWANFSR